MSEAAPLLRIEGVSVRRGGRLLLDDVSFSASRGEIAGVIGPNGAGKTTLFETIATRDRREILFYMPDGVRPWEDRRAGWCLDFFARLFGRERDGEAIDALQLAPLLGQRVRSLSKGEAKRLLLALALSTPQPLLLLDEPFDGLDFRQTRGAMELLRARAAAGRALVLSIHQLADATRVCDRFLLLDHGRVLAQGDLASLRARAGNGEASLEEVFLALE